MYGYVFMFGLVILGMIFLGILLILSFFWSVPKKSTSAPPAIPSYEDSGAIAYADTTNDANVPYMGTINADDILFISAFSAEDGAFSTPSGWTELAQVHQASGGNTMAWYWRRATGSETGTVVVHHSVSSHKFGIMRRYSGCNTGTFFEDVTTIGPNTTGNQVPASAEITTTGPNRLAVCFCEGSNDKSCTGQVDWTKDQEELSILGSDCVLTALSRNIASASTVPQEVWAYSTDLFWASVSFGMRG